MKKLKNKLLRHILSVGVVVAFILLSLASVTLFIPEGYQEGPCESIPTLTVAYAITISVTDKITGTPIPYADVRIKITHTNHEYLGISTCVLSPADYSYDQLSGVSDGSGIVTFSSAALRYYVTIDKTELDVQVSKDNYTPGEASLKLSPSNSSRQINIKLIDLSAQP